MHEHGLSSASNSHLPVPLSAVFMGIAMAFPHARDRNWQDNLFSPVLFGVLSMA
jgi:hypothetical protein